MRYLFIHQNFPGQFLHIVRHVVRQPGNEVVFITEPNPNYMVGVRRANYQLKRQENQDVHPDAREFDVTMARAEAVAGVADNLKRLGYTPDIVIGHQGWGEMLNIDDVWRKVPMLGYYEFYYHTLGIDVNFDPEFPTEPSSYSRIRAKNCINLLALTNNGFGQTPTAFQRDTYPAWARERITLLEEGVNLDTCRPDPSVKTQDFAIGDFHVSPDDKLVTYVARDIEPYRGGHVMIRALPDLLRARPDVKVILVGGDGVSYGAKIVGTTWREMFMREVLDRVDLSRICFPGRIDYDTYVKMLQRSDAHVYLTYPFVASWSLRESLAVGCAVVGSDTEPVAEFITHGKNGLLTPCLDPGRLAETVLKVLGDKALTKRLGAAARRFAERRLAMDDYLKRYEALIQDTIDRN